MSEKPPVITSDEVTALLPKNVKWSCDIFLTGGIVKNGWSANDADILAPDATKEEMAEMRDFFTKLFGWKTDVGQHVMPEREPVYLCKIFSNTLKCLQ